jgi:ribonuclease P protein component
MLDKRLSPMSDSSFPPSSRLQSSRDFERVYSQKRKSADGTLLVFAAENDLNITRIGLSVSKKHGGSVVRNRLKRWLREAFRLERTNLPVGYDFIAIPLAAERASLVSYRQSISKLARRLSKRTDREGELTS